MRSEQVPLHAASPAAREELLIILVRRKLSLQHKIVRGRGEASARLDAGLPRAPAKPGLLNDLSLSGPWILFAAPLLGFSGVLVR